MLDKLDIWLSIIDILFCIADIAIIVYLFFYRFPPEKSKKIFSSRILRKKRK